AMELILPVKWHKNIDQVFEMLFQNLGGKRSTNKNMTKSGREIICEWYNLPIIDEKGKVVGVSSLAIDVTEKIRTQEKLAESNNRFKLLSELTFEGIIIHDQGFVHTINPSIERITQYTKGELLGKNIIELLICEEYKSLVIENIQKSIAKPYEIQINRKDGSVIWVEVESKDFHFEGKDLRVASIRDIQDRKLNDQKLKKALLDAQESDLLKSSFLSTISHELRTPLNAVIGFSDLIDETMEIEEAASLAKMIFKSGNHLLEIINDIFDLSSLQEGTLLILSEKFNLHTALDEIKEFGLQERRKMAKSNLELNFKLNPADQDIEISTDHKRFKQIFIHLIRNALKYTKEGHIEVGYSILADSIRFYVKDTGIGIAKEKQKHIFELFRQLDDRHTREYEGVGIGLSIAKTLCKNLGGEISLDSNLHMGSTFYVKIPYQPSVAELKKINTDIQTDFTLLIGKIILIAEDDANSFELLEMYLKPYKTKILWAKNGVEAIDLFSKNQQINLILMDIKMPVLSGYEAAKEIKKMNPNVPIIAQTAYAINNEKEIALEAGCDDYLSKPISWSVLFEKIMLHLENKKG
ncbi:MAG: PAS domain S-box protein, partial [Bacteroidales bacterium]|nr:PAS domain S-box protein [Bacteroidales bacterium]